MLLETCAIEADGVASEGTSSKAWKAPVGSMTELSCQEYCHVAFYTLYETVQ